MTETFTALQALEELKESIVKQWGDIPTEISDELKTLEMLLTPVEAPSDEPKEEVQA
jgi:hypothetical protein